MNCIHTWNRATSPFPHRPTWLSVHRQNVQDRGSTAVDTLPSDVQQRQAFRLVAAEPGAHQGLPLRQERRE